MSNDNILPSHIENIIFDFGGVLLELYSDKTYRALSDLLQIDFSFDNLPAEVVLFLYKFEKGEMRFETFLWNLQRLSAHKTPQPRPIIDAWNAMLGGWQPSKLELLKTLKPHFNLYLLSNTNETHLDWVYKDLRVNHNINNFESRFFTKAYYSHLIGMRKPDIEIYNFVINDSGVDPTKTLFIDDNLDNIKIARKAGLNVIHHKCNDSLDFLLSLVDNK